MARLPPDGPFAPLLTVPGWAAVRVGNYGGALGDPIRFDNYRQIYRTAGLNPIQYESAGSVATASSAARAASSSAAP